MNKEQHNFFIGGIAGIVSRTLTAPLELNKIQSQNRFIPHTSLKEVIRMDGLRGLWKGNFSNCIRIFPQTAINNMCYQYIHKYLKHQNNNKNKNKYLNFILNDDSINLFAGALSGKIAMTSIYPLENIRSRLSLQTKNQHYRGIIDIFRKTNLRTLYNGLGMSLIGFAPYNALNFMFFHKYLGIIERFYDDDGSGEKGSGEKHKHHSLNRLLCGGFAGVSAVTVTYPTDLIRRRLQLQGGGFYSSVVPRYHGIIDCISKVIKYEGIKGLYAGLIPCYIKIFPTMAIQLWIISSFSIH